MRTWPQRLQQLSGWSVSIYLFNSLNRFYDYVLYTAALAKFGVLKGGAIMMAISFVLDFATLRVYDRLKLDLFGIEALKSLRERTPTNWTERMTIWALRQSEFVVFMVLTLLTNQFVVVAWMRHGARQYNGMTQRDWVIFLSSFFIGHLYWIGILSLAIGFIRRLLLD